MFTAAQFTMVKIGSNLMSINREQIKKMCNLYTLECYPAVKDNDIMPFTAAWTDKEIVIPSKENQAEEKYYDIPYM